MKALRRFSVEKKTSRASLQEFLNVLRDVAGFTALPRDIRTILETNVNEEPYEEMEDGM